MNSYFGKHRNRNCYKCGRYLPSLRSQRLGIGPKCLKREREKLAREFKEPQRVKARKLLSGRSLTPVKRGVYRVRSGSNTYLTAKNACTCPSGRYRPVWGSCYHELAVQMKEVR